MSSHLSKEVTSQDHSIGPLDAPVTLVEYGDYQCQFCAKAHPILKRVLSRMDGVLRFVFRNFPLSQGHPLARSAARAAEAAALQGKFWPMHDALYENHASLSEEKIRVLANDMGLDPERFESDWQERETVEQHVQQDFMSGVRSGVSGTPGFFINGEKYEGAWNEDDLIRALSIHIGSSKKTGRAA
jgi:protein-disulfide isomerase